MVENVLLFLVWLSRRERCPWCGSMDNHDYDHKDGCPTIGTCGQIGPPWNLCELHPDPEPHPQKGQFETINGYYDRCRPWWNAYHDHRREVHGIGQLVSSASGGSGRPV